MIQKGKYRPKSFQKWSDSLDTETWWELFEASFINENDDLLKQEYNKYLTEYLRDKKLKDLL